jgi:hypothetical protein
LSDPRTPRAPAGTSGAALMQLARRDRSAARAALRALSVEEQARLCGELRPELRGEFLLLTDHPEHVVPLLEPATLVVAVRGAGMSEAAWLLELATREQRIACIDLDCWQSYDLELPRVNEWIDALIEAGRPTLLRALDEFDPEIWLLAMKDQTEVAVVGREDEPPDGYFTEDGVVYFKPNSDEAFARVREVMQSSFSERQPRYWQLVYGMLFELPSECEEYALRWRTGRLTDLGFPELEAAMRVYRPLALGDTEVLDAPVEFGEHGARGAALVLTRELPGQYADTLLARTLAELEPDRARDVVGYVLGVANTLAVADRMRLSEPDTAARALEKAVRGIERGLREVAAARSRSAREILERAHVFDLFRAAATLDPELRKAEERGETG